MSAFYNGLLNTMKANYEILDRGIRVIRPLVYVREALLRQFAHDSKLPIIEDNCPACFVSPTVR